MRALKVVKIMLIHNCEQKKNLEVRVLKLSSKTNDYKNNTR